MTESEFKKLLWAGLMLWLADRYLFPILDSTIGHYLPPRG